MNNNFVLDSDIIDLEMQKAFHRDQGLTMLDFRTGSGKSFDLEKNIARFIYDWRNNQPLMVGDAEETKHAINQIIVLIPNKNNFLKYDDLADRLMEVSDHKYKEAEALQIIADDVYTMPNNLDCMIDGLSSHGIIDDNKVDRICSAVKDLFSSTTAKDLVKDFQCISDYAKCRRDEKLKIYAESMGTSATNAEKDIRTKIRSFISKCKKILRDENKTEAEKFKAACDKEKCCRLVESFYEIANYGNYRVIVTTVDKFMYSVDPIISTKFPLYDREFVKDKLIIFDESDSAYVRMKEIIVKRVNDGTFPFKEYLKTLICNYLEVQPTEVVTNAIKLAFEGKNSKYSWESLRRQGKEILEKYFLRYPYKTDEETMKKGKMPALLNDGTLYTLSEKRGYIHAVKNGTKKQVLLSVGEGPDDKLSLGTNDEVVQISNLFREGNAFIYHFGCFLNTVAQKYQNLMVKNEREKAKKLQKQNKGQSDEESGERNISFQDDLKTILNMFGIIGRDQEFYVQYCMNLKNKPKKVDLFDVDLSFYSRGYDIKIIRDNAISQAENSMIYSYMVTSTPESILLHMAQCTHVICLSATALNRSVNENFDISYLKERLQLCFHTVSPETKAALRKFYARKETPYADGKCCVDVVPLPENGETVSGDDKDEHLKAEAALPAFQHKEILDDLLKKISAKAWEIRMKTGSENQAQYYYGRYLNLLHGLYEFIRDPSLKSMVVLEKAAVKEDKADLDLNLIKEMVCDCSIDLNVREEIPVITAVAKDFDDKKNEAKGYWEKGQKAIFFSTYETTSKGSNLQYAIPSVTDIRKNLVTLLPEYAEASHLHSKYEYKDVDCLYLGNYSYLLSLIEGEGLTERTGCFHKVLFELQKLAWNGEISFWQKQMIARDRYRKVIGNGKNTSFDRFKRLLKNTEGVSNTVNKIIKQSVGRMDRVNQKNAMTKIFIATENLKQMDLNELEETKDDMIPAMKQIFEAAKVVQGGYDPKSYTEKMNQKVLLMAAKKHNESVECFKQVLRVMNNATDNKVRNMAIAEYNRIRELVMRYPVISKEVMELLPRAMQRIVNRYYINSERNDVVSYSFSVNKKEENKDLDLCHIELEGFNMNSAARHVGEQYTILETAMKVEGVAHAFKQKGYCTKWQPGQYILTPKGMDLYNGMLGEEVEKIILQGIINDVERFDGKLSLSSIEDMAPEVYERFDFRYGNIYIDAKNWRYGVANSDAQQFKQHVLDKKEECDAFYKQNGVAVILNLLPLDGEDHKEYNEPGYYEIPALINKDGKVIETAAKTLLELFRKANKNAR